MGKKSTRDPLRQIWRIYCLFIAFEGVLIVLGLSAILVDIDIFVARFNGTGIGVIIYAGGLGIAYLAVVGIIRPLIVWNKSIHFPGTDQLPGTLEIIVPGFRDKEYSQKKMTEIATNNSAFKLLSKQRIIRNGTVFLFGIMALVLLVVFK